VSTAPGSARPVTDLLTVGYGGRPPAELAAVVAGALDAAAASRPGPFVLLCAERDVARCHRRLLADHLVAGGRYRLVAHL
jgi:hypothetical protein